MTYVIGIIIWVFIAIKLGNAVSKGTTSIITSATYRAYEKQKNAIGRKYTNEGISSPSIVDIHRKGDKVWNQYKAEIAELDASFGFKRN